MNLLEGGLDADGETLRLGRYRIPLPESTLKRRQGLRRFLNGDVVVGIRPEHLSYSPGRNGAGLEGSVTLVESLGSELVVHCQVDVARVQPEGLQDDELEGQPLPLQASADVVARLPPRTAVKPGQRLGLGIDVEELQFFDPVSGISQRWFKSGVSLGGIR